MKAMTAMWRKDVRQLFWPWCALMAASLLSFWTRSLEHSGGPQTLLAATLPLGAFFGLPLLAGLALGTEFQYRTFALTLAQPVDRRTLWRQKALVSWAAVAPPLLLFCLAAYISQGNYDVWFTLAFTANAIVATSALIFWTLVARGIIGGLALCGLTQGFLYLALLKAAEQNHNYRLMYNLPGRYSPGFLAAAAVVLLGYSATMVLLGRRSMLRYQSVEGVVASDILPDISLAPRWLASSLVPRPRGVVANLVRRELHLLRPVWLLTAASVAGWIFASAFHIISPRMPSGKISTLEFTTIALGSMLGAAIAAIAGALPIGEERNLGTHALQMTLPLSARVQWLVKLAVATVTGAICAGMLPVLVLTAAGLLQGSATRFVEPEALWQLALGGACLSLLAFWCACSTNATVKAILWTFPAGGALLMAAALGVWLASTWWQTMGLESWGVARWIFRHVDPFRLPDWISVFWIFRLMSPAVFLVPALLYGLFQSYRVFRADTSEGNHLIRNLLPLAGLAFIVGVLPLCVGELAMAAGSQQQKFAREIHTGIEELLTADIAKNGDGHTLRISSQELAAATPLSEDTRRWLGSADISVVSKRGKWDTGVQCCWLYWQPLLVQATPTQYFATINRSGAPRCVFGYAVNTSRWYVGGRFVEHKNGIVRGNCKQ
jgi:hypothetical protein